MALFVDFEAHTCNFETEDFYALLEIARDFVCVPTAANPNSLYSYSPADGEALLLYTGLGSVSDYPDALAAGLEPVSLLDGSHAALNPTDGIFSISKTCAAPELAWELVSYVFTDYAQELTGRFSFPVLAAAYDQLEANQLAAETISASDAAAVRSLLSDVTHRTVLHAFLLDIVLEEAAACLAGDKSVQETAALIQSRAQLYLDEQS